MNNLTAFSTQDEEKKKRCLSQSNLHWTNTKSKRCKRLNASHITLTCTGVPLHRERREKERGEMREKERESCVKFSLLKDGFACVLMTNVKRAAAAAAAKMREEGG